MSRESYAGFHYYGTFTTCPRKWFLKYYKKWKTISTPPPLLFGGAIHAAIKSFYERGSKDAMLGKFEIEMEENCPKYEDNEVFEKDYIRGKEILSKYFDEHETDLDTYDVVELEQGHEVTVPGVGYVVTVRPDRILYNKQSRMYEVHETKTTSWSVPGVYNSLKYQKQTTMYLWAMQYVHPDKNIRTVIPDVLYNRGKVIQCERGVGITKSDYELRQFEYALVGIISNLSERVQNIGKFPDEELFYVNPFCDGGQSWKCEYRDVCGEPATDYLPYGFELDEEEFE